MTIKEIKHDSNFNTIIEHENKILENDKDFIYFGTITYVVKSDEDYFLKMIGEELFKIY